MKRIVPVVIILLFLSGLGLLIYPAISNWLADQEQTSRIIQYGDSVADMDAEKMEEEFEKAKAYNNALTGSDIEDPFIPGSGIVLPDNYAAVLNIGGIMGYLDIPKINVSQTIRHGTSEEVLRKGVGHIENTAFPIGGKGNHAVLTGHTGLSSAKLFTDLTELEEGDVFYVTVLDQTLAYEVDLILVVEPDETDALRPVKGEDYVTLVTCTPYSINSHRLLVRGTRIPYAQETEEQPAEEPAEATPWVGWYILISVLCVLIAATIIIVVIKRRRQRRNGL